MTIQATDSIFWNGKLFEIVECSDGEPFDPVLHGFTPIEASTACARGYVCEYNLDEGRLILDRLYISDEDDNPPEVHGRNAVLSENPFIGRWLFNDVHLPLMYTGGLLVARGLLRNRHGRMFFPPLLSYRHVYELVFDSGQLQSSADVSTTIAHIRRKAASTKYDQGAKVEAWLRESFQRGYRR